LANSSIKECKIELAAHAGKLLGWGNGFSKPNGYVDLELEGTVKGGQLKGNWFDIFDVGQLSEPFEEGGFHIASVLLTKPLIYTVVGVDRSIGSRAPIGEAQATFDLDEICPGRRGSDQSKFDLGAR